MSDTIIKIIPRKIDARISQELMNATISYLKSHMEAEKINAVSYDKITFVDSGENLESILCPSCGERISFLWWGKQMDIAYQNNFADLTVELPCCKLESNLNELNYRFPCGFASCSIEIQNLKGTIEETEKVELEKILGEEIKLVEARY